MSFLFLISHKIKSADHSAGNHGTAGISIRYSFSPISAIVQVKERNSFVLFLIRMLGVVGGIISTSGELFFSFRSSLITSIHIVYSVLVYTVYYTMFVFHSRTLFLTILIDYSTWIFQAVHEMKLSHSWFLRNYYFEHKY